MQELKEERQAVQQALEQYRMFGWLWELDAGARPEPIRSTYLQEVAACDIYIGLFWCGYGQYTIEEYEHARQQNKPCLVYIKKAADQARDPQLQAFLDKIQRVTDPQGLTPARFETASELAAQLQKDVLHLLTTVFRQSRQQPASATPSQPASTTHIAAAGFGSVAVGTIQNFTQNNYGRDDKKEPSA